MLRPTFLAFETAKRAITANQLALDTTGHNMANAEVPGYTRQRVDTVSFGNAGYQSRFQIYGQTLPGLGVSVTGINQIRDRSLDNRFRAQATTMAELGIRADGLDDLNAIFDELQVDGLHAKIGELMDTLEKLSTDVNSKEYGMVVRTTAEQITQILNEYAKGLDNIEAQQLSDLDVTVAKELNQTLKEIALLNEKIQLDHIYGVPSNELMDERNLLIDRLSEYADIKVEYTERRISEDQTVEQLNISINGTNPPIYLVKHDQYCAATYDYQTNPSPYDQNTDPDKYPALIFNLTEMTNTKVMADPSTLTIAYADINDDLTKGGLKAYLDLFNGVGNLAASGTPTNDNSFRGIPYYRLALNDFAATFASMMNAQNEDGDPLTPLTDDMLFIAYDQNAATPITAANITVSQAWRDDPLHINVSRLANPQEDNTNVLAFIKLLTSTEISFANGVKGTFEEYLVNYQAEMGLDKKLNQTLLDASIKVMNGLQDQRDAISGVSHNEEGIHMMQYQNAYNAMLRYMTTMDEALDQIINGMGVVGR